MANNPTRQPERESNGSLNHAPTSRASLSLYITLSLLVIAYVAVLTGNRSEMPDADAWEHHRAVLAMSQSLMHPGNPTYATDEPSIRYSPYTVSLTLIVKATGMDPYDVLSGAAVFNTCLLLLAVWFWLRAYGLQNAAPCALLCILFLYGYPPGYANSLALSDLPWQQVNPSAFAMPLMILAWAWLAHARGKSLIPFTLVTAVLLAIALLSHGMSAAMGGLGLLVTAVHARRDERMVRLAAVCIAALVSLTLALAWPWYNLLFALTHTPNKDYWFNPAILKLMLLSWCLPAIVLLFVTLPLRDQPFIRTALYATLVTLIVAAIGAFVTSPTLARLPLAGLIFPQAAVGVFLHQTAALDPRTWPKRIRHIFNRDRAAASPPLIEAGVVVTLLALALPNALLTLDQPHLARKWVAPILHKENKQPDIRNTYRTLLADHLKPGEVVLAQSRTGWPVPSFGGRIVSALHYEFFTPDQKQRTQDVNQFFLPNQTPATRIDILERYHVAWLLINKDNLSDTQLHELLIPGTVVNEVGPYVLIDANAWIKSQQTQAGQTTEPDD